MKIDENRKTFLFPVENARGRDVSQIAALTRRLAPNVIPVSEPEIQRHLDSYRVIRADDTILASAALHPQTHHRVQVRSVTVAPESHGMGLGKTLIRALQAEIGRTGRALVCITTSPDFFQRLGFERKEDVPVDPRPERAGCPAPARRVGMIWEPPLARWAQLACAWVGIEGCQRLIPEQTLRKPVPVLDIASHPWFPERENPSRKEERNTLLDLSHTF